MAIEVGSFQVSLSAFQTWQRCETKYYNSYVRKLRPKDQYLAPTLGRILHTYLENYYDGLRSNFKAEDAHLSSQLKTSEKYLGEIRGYVNTSLAAGSTELAKELSELPALAGRITDRYFQVRGKEDAKRYKILRVEQYLHLPIAEGIHSTGVVDLVAQDQANGRLSLWEHKSTENVPRDSVRMRDFQTMLYGVKLRWQNGTIIDSVLWNYIRTKEPVAPEILKSGVLTKRKDIDTTWQVYSAAVEGVGGDPDAAEYAEMKYRLSNREETVFFPRFEQVVVVNEEALMDDYITEAKRMKAARESWAKGESKPVKTIDRSCDYCEYYRLCQATLIGGDEEDIIKMKYNGG